MADNPERNRQGEIDQLSAYRQQRITGWFLCGVSAAAVTAFVLLLKYHYSIPAGICLAAAAATLMAGRFLLVIYPPEHMDEATRTARRQKLGRYSTTWANSLCGILVPAFLMLSSMFMFLFSAGIKPLQAFFAILFLISGVQVNRGHKHPSRIDDRISSMILKSYDVYHAQPEKTETSPARNSKEEDGASAEEETACAERKTFTDPEEELRERAARLVRGEEKPDPHRPPVRTKTGEKTREREFEDRFVVLKTRYSTIPGWEYTKLGFDPLTRKVFYIETRKSRPGSGTEIESNIRESTFDQLKQDTGLEITGENCEQFIPHKESVPMSGRAPEPVNPADCEYKEKKDVAACCMKVFRPGEISIFYFRKCPEGYRALYLYGPSGEEAVKLPGMLPTEAEIDELIRDNTRYEITDRLLTEEEVCCFHNRYHSVPKEDRRIIGHGSACTVLSTGTLIRTNGWLDDEELEIAHCIQVLATDGIRKDARVPASWPQQSAEDEETAVYFETGRKIAEENPDALPDDLLRKVFDACGYQKEVLGHISFLYKPGGKVSMSCFRRKAGYVIYAVKLPGQMTSCECPSAGEFLRCFRLIAREVFPGCIP